MVLIHCVHGSPFTSSNFVILCCRQTFYLARLFQNKVMNNKAQVKTNKVSPYSSGFSGGGPHGCSIFWRKLNLTLVFVSFSATAKNSTIEWCPI